MNASACPDSLPALLRDIVTSGPIPVIVHCAYCTAPILSGTSVTGAVSCDTLCAACALDEAAPIAVKALTLNEPEQDLLTLQRASEVLTGCAAQFAAFVAARKGTP